MRMFYSARSLGWLALLVAVPPSAVSAQPAATWSRIVGNFCLQGIPLSARKVEQTEINNGVPVEQFKVDFASANPPASTLMRVFRKPPQAQSPLTRCSDLDGDVILEGRVKKLTIRGARETGASGGTAYFEVGGSPESLLDVELTKVKSTLAPLYGGLLQLGASGSIAPSSLAWVHNAGRIAASTGAPGTGALDVETWGRKLRGAHLRLPGSEETTTSDLSAGNTNITLRVAVDGTSTELRRGTLTSDRLKLESASFAVPGSRFSDFKGSADALKVVADEAGVGLQLVNLGYKANQGTVGSETTQAHGANFSGVIGLITSPGARSGESIEFSQPRILNHVAAAEGCEWSHRQVLLTAATTCQTVVTTADQAGMLVRFGTNQPTALMAGDALVPKGAVAWSLERSDSEERLAGQVARADSQLGSLALTSQTATFGNPVAAGAELTIPFSLAVGPANGTWQIGTGAGPAAIGGNLEQLLLKGQVAVPLAQPARWHVDIAENDFRFAGGISGEVRPHVYDGTPIFAAGTQLGFRSATALRIAKDAQEGKIETSLAAFVLSNLDIKLGKKAANLVLKGPLAFEGETVLDYDLSDGRAEIVEGALDVQNVHLVSEPGKPGDLGSVRVRDADFAVASIEAKFDREENAGGFLIQGVTLGAGQVEQIPEDGADQLRWSGTLGAPLTIESIGAKIVRSKDNALVLEDEVATNLALDLVDPTLGQGKQLHFSGKRMQLAFAKVSRADVVGSLKMAGATIRQKADGADFDINDLDLALDITGGPLSGPNGSGTLRTGGVNVNIDIDPEVKFGGDITRCNGSPEYRTLPLNVRFKTASVDMDLAMTDGQFKAAGHAGVSDAYVKERGQYECRKRVVAFRIVKEVRAKYKYPCPTWRKPFRMCRGWTTIVPELHADIDRLFRIRHVRAAGVWNAVDLRIFPQDGETKFTRCLKVGAFVPVVDASYFFTPKTNVAIADNIFQELIDLHSRPFMSGFTSGFAGMLGNGLQLTKNGWCV